MANVFEVWSSGVITTTTHNLIHFGGVKTAVLRAKYSRTTRENVKKMVQGGVRSFIQRLFLAGVLSRLQKDPKLSNRFIFRGSMVCPRTNWPWITGKRWTDSFRFWFSLNKCWKRELVHGWSITQYPAVKACNKLGFVHNTSSPDSDADLEYNWKTCRKRKKCNVWSLIKFF